MLVMLKHR